MGVGGEHRGTGEIGREAGTLGDAGYADRDRGEKLTGSMRKDREHEKRSGEQGGGWKCGGKQLSGLVSDPTALLIIRECFL